MYAFLDKRPAQLPLAPRIVVTGLRLWASAIRSRQCAIEPLGALLQHWGLPDALWPTHNLFIWIRAQARRSLMLGCPSCGMVSEDEALLLCALFPAPGIADGAVDTALRELVRDEAVAQASRLARKLQGDLNHVQESLTKRAASHSSAPIRPDDSV